jgi:hypothetical protein
MNNIPVHALLSPRHLLCGSDDCETLLVLLEVDADGSTKLLSETPVEFAQYAYALFPTGLIRRRSENVL